MPAPDQLRIWSPQKTNNPRRMCIFAHYAPQNRVDDGLVHQLYMLSACAQVIFVTQSQLPGSDIELLRQYCTDILHIPVDAAGRDFTSYAHGVEHLVRQGRLALTHWLWLVNDSFYGPFWSLEAWRQRVERAEQHRIGAWGLTNSFQLTYHLQSYFVALSSAVFKTARFTNFMRKPWSHGHVIQRGELALFREVIHPHRTLGLRSAHNHERFNPYHFDWKGTLMHAGIVKKRIWNQLKGQMISDIKRMDMDEEQRARLLMCMR